MEGVSRKLANLGCSVALALISVVCSKVPIPDGVCRLIDFFNKLLTGIDILVSVSVLALVCLLAFVCSYGSVLQFAWCVF